MNVRPHVGVNLLWLVPGIVGGSEEYTTRLLRGLAEWAGDDVRIMLFVNEPFVASYPDLVSAFPTRVCHIDGLSKPRRVLAESTWLARETRQADVDLVHHAGGTIPPIRTRPAIVTIHDLQPLLLKGTFTRVKQAYLRWRLPPTVTRSRLIVTISEHAKRSIVERLGGEPDRIVIVSPGYSNALPEPPNGDPLATYRLAGLRWFVYPAITYPHKNHLVLVRAFAKAAAAHDDVVLVLTSRADSMEEEVMAEAARLGVADRVRRPGRISRGDLDWLIKHAVALTFPSRYEGFGIPVLEAMGLGCPVISANTTSLPEVVDGAGIMLDPDDVDGWAAAMEELLTHDDRRQWLREAGFGQTARFSWKASTDRLVAAYLRALAFPLHG